MIPLEPGMAQQVRLVGPGNAQHRRAWGSGANSIHHVRVVSCEVSGTSKIEVRIYGVKVERPARCLAEGNL